MGLWRGIVGDTEGEDKQQGGSARGAGRRERAQAEADPFFDPDFALEGLQDGDGVRDGGDEAEEVEEAPEWDPDFTLEAPGGAAQHSGVGEGKGPGGAGEVGVSEEEWVARQVGLLQPQWAADRALVVPDVMAGQG